MHCNYIALISYRAHSIPNCRVVSILLCCAESLLRSLYDAYITEILLAFSLYDRVQQNVTIHLCSICGITCFCYPATFALHCRCQRYAPALKLHILKSCYSAYVTEYIYILYPNQRATLKEKAMAIEGNLIAVVIFAERIQAARAINAWLL